MHRLLVSVLFLTLVLSVTSALASKELTVREVETVVATPIIIGASGLQQACQVGNVNPPAWALGGFMLPPEEYKLVFDPTTTCSICPVGFQPNAVHVLLQTTEACTLTMAVDVEEAGYPTSPDCPEPGTFVSQ